MSSSLNLQDEVNQSINGRVNHLEELLGKGIMMPFNNTNSGSRKLMYSVQLEQRFPLMNPEVPLVMTGYEDQFGHYSSSFVKNERRATVIAKIPKFSFRPKDHYYLILMDDPDENGIRNLRLIERVSYKHISESYGYLVNNDDIDYLKVDDVVEPGSVLQKSTSFDEYNNRMDGTNLITTYLSTEHTMEDGIMISDYAAKHKLASPLIKVVEIVINDNDIPLNIHGDNDYYKAFPEIGEEIDGDILYVTRSATNNGVSGSLQKINSKINKSNCITIGAEGKFAFYQDVEFEAGVKIYALRNGSLNKYNALFLCTLLNLEVYKYNYGRARVLEKIKSEKIKLPVNSLGQPDYSYMENYIKQLQYSDLI